MAEKPDASWPERDFPMGKRVVPTNAEDAGSKGTPPTTEQIPDSDIVDGPAPRGKGNPVK
jgi:hypothetical protein